MAIGTVWVSKVGVKIKDTIEHDSEKIGGRRESSAPPTNKEKNRREKRVTVFVIIHIIIIISHSSATEFKSQQQPNKIDEK